MSIYDYHRRATHSVQAGRTTIGGESPIRVQTMANVDTNDIEAAVAQAERCARAGAELIRFTTQGTREVESLGRIHAELRARGVETPLVADIHFNPAVAEAAAATVEAIRINPGNFVAGHEGEYTDEQWQAELDEIRQRLRPIIAICRSHGTAVRIGVNHGSLSRRIMSRYGNTARGLAESCIEFIGLCRELDFHDIVLSVKASNVRVMVASVRLLVRMMDERDMRYPIHLGVTEAGSDDEGRIKSAVGIGTLLMEGIGDTVRVSLTERPEAEIPVAEKLVRYINHRNTDVRIDCHTPWPCNPYEYNRRVTNRAGLMGDRQVPVVVSYSDGLGTDYTVMTAPRFLMLGGARDIDSMTAEALAHNPDVPLMLNPANPNFAGEIRAMISELDRLELRNPVIASRVYMTDDIEELQVMAGTDFGGLLIDGLLDGIYIYCRSARVTEQEVVKMEFAMLQAAGARITDTEYITCPGCGRTKYDINAVARRVKEATRGYKGLKIAVMGCIVNGPGEMADADYGYVGGARGRVSLYRGRLCVEHNIAEEDAIEHLIRLIEHDRRP